MHLAIKFLLIWALLGSLIPACMVAAPVFVSGRYSMKQRITILLLGGPPVLLVLLVGAVAGAVMATVHRMRPGRPLVPPAPPRA